MTETNLFSINTTGNPLTKLVPYSKWTPSTFMYHDILGEATNAQKIMYLNRNGFGNRYNPVNPTQEMNDFEKVYKVGSRISVNIVIGFIIIILLVFIVLTLFKPSGKLIMATIVLAAMAVGVYFLGDYIANDRWDHFRKKTGYMLKDNEERVNSKYDASGKRHYIDLVGLADTSNALNESGPKGFKDSWRAIVSRNDDSAKLDSAKNGLLAGVKVSGMLF